MNKKDIQFQCSSRKREAIVTIAEKLFFKHGIKRITIEEICEKAGISKGTFYKYFTNKANLVDRLLENWKSEGENILEEMNSPDISFSEKFQMLLEFVTSFYSKMNIEFLDDYIPIDEPTEDFEERYRKFYSDAQKRGDIRPDIRVEFMTTVSKKIWELARDRELRALYPNTADFMRELTHFFYLGVSGRIEPCTRGEVHKNKVSTD